MVQYIYTLGVAGERLSVSELGRTVEYTYDNLYRLTGETITEGEKVTAYTYAYDSVGNRILKTKNGAETEYSYNELNQLVYDSDATYEYDLNGNLVRVIGGAQAALYEYNSENKLIKATVQQGINVVEETYTYDYAGNRTSKSTHTSDGNFEVVKYLNDNSSLTNVLAELDSDGNVQVYYTIGADLISQERDGRTYTYLYDGHGSVVGMTDESGRVTDTYVYDAFGNLLKSTGRTENNYRYCGEQFDSTTGLYYLRARYMDTSTGRFISQDSFAGSAYDPVSLHKYLYANSNPVMYSDPSGYMSLGETMCVSAIIGGTCGAFINVAGYLDMLVGWRNFNLNDMLQAAFEGFLEGMTYGLLFGAVFYGLSYLCALIPALTGLDTAIGYTFGICGVSSALSEAYSAYKSGNRATAFAYTVLAVISGKLLFDSIYSNFAGDKVTSSETSFENNNVSRNRLGNSVQPTEKTLDMALDKKLYADTIAEKYGINLKGSGQPIIIEYNPELVPAGRVCANNPNVIELGPNAFISEEELANTIAHELNHSRSFLNGGNAPEPNAYEAGNSLADYIRGGR